MQAQQPLQGALIHGRKNFGNEKLQMIDGGNIDASNIWFSKEAHFYLDSFPNKWNWRIWGSQNPHVCVPQSLNGKKLLYWQRHSKVALSDLFSYRIQCIPIFTLKFCENLWPFKMTWNLQPINTSWFIQNGAILQEHLRFSYFLRMNIISNLVNTTL